MQGTSPRAPMHASGNLLLDALPEPHYRRLAPHLELVPLLVGRVLAATHVHFPTTGVVSVVTALEGEEVAVTGNEGLIGTSSFLEQTAASAPPRVAVVEHPGHAWRLPAELLVEQFDSEGELRRLLLRHTQALITQIAQTVACNRHHRIEEQLCRWLLLRLDRLPGCELRATQKRIANLLGVRREAITAAARELRRAGLVRLGRGRITVIDRQGLEQRACECYTVVRREYARLLARKRPRQAPKESQMRRRETLEVTTSK